MTARLLSVIMVNYRSADLVGEALASLYRFNPDQPMEVFVVDNASGDDGREKVTARFPQVRWIDMKYNAGFARANNAAMRQASGDTFLLLYPDTVCLDESVRQCYLQLNATPYVAAGVQLFDADKQPQISGSFFVKGGLNHLLPIPYWGDLIRWLGYKAGSRVPNVPEARGLQEVDWISGAFLMVKRSAVERVGYMDEDFFLYAEEVEWCSRLRRAGKLCLFGHLRIVHLEGGSINRDRNLREKGYYNLYDRKGLQLMVSNHLRVRKQYGVFWFLFLLLNYTWGVFFFLVCSTIHEPLKGKLPFRRWNKVFQFGKNMLRLWSLAPRIISNKPYFYKMF